VYLAVVRIIAAVLLAMRRVFEGKTLLRKMKIFDDRMKWRVLSHVLSYVLSVLKSVAACKRTVKCLGNSFR